MLTAQRSLSKRLNLKADPMLIISASGIATGGRVIHHIKAFGPHEKNTLLFTGFQAAGTRGQKIVNGGKTIKIHGQEIPIRAEVSIAEWPELNTWRRKTLGFITPGIRFAKSIAMID
jgi:metallo-beta-lactamase family protein